jgi:hypothetical protein
LEELEQQRHSLYQQTAHVIIETGRPHINHLVQQIVEKLPCSDRTFSSSETMKTVHINATGNAFRL